MNLGIRKGKVWKMWSKLLDSPPMYTGRQYNHSVYRRSPYFTRLMKSTEHKLLPYRETFYIPYMYIKNPDVPRGKKIQAIVKCTKGKPQQHLTNTFSAPYHKMNYNDIDYVLNIMLVIIHQQEPYPRSQIQIERNSR